MTRRTTAMLTAAPVALMGATSACPAQDRIERPVSFYVAGTAGGGILLRRAFDATMQDADFRAEAARLQADVARSTGEDVQRLVEAIYATPRPVIERARKLLAR
jgi:tripartite-type tricarboxylate transporter receptor subunit TctC